MSINVNGKIFRESLNSSDNLYGMLDGLNKANELANKFGVDIGEVYAASARLQHVYSMAITITIHQTDTDFISVFLNEYKTIGTLEKAIANDSFPGLLDCIENAASVKEN